MEERPIIFSGEMAKAIREGRKTQTRRVVRFSKYNLRDITISLPQQCPYGYIGDRLWVRETWQAHLCCGRNNEQIHYRADGESCPIDGEKIKSWRPSIFMPRWASRITLEITNVRVERLQKITEEDAKAEGVWEKNESYQGVGDLPSDRFERLWNSINGKKHPWENNCWVWVIEFRNIE